MTETVNFGSVYDLFTEDERKVIYKVLTHRLLKNKIQNYSLLPFVSLKRIQNNIGDMKRLINTSSREDPLLVIGVVYSLKECQNLLSAAIKFEELDVNQKEKTSA